MSRIGRPQATPYIHRIARDGHEVRIGFPSRKTTVGKAKTYIVWRYLADATRIIKPGKPVVILAIFDEIDRGRS